MICVIKILFLIIKWYYLFVLYDVCNINRVFIEF